ncbi:MAG: hypothetical protein HOO96_35840 [Polyangiaceae bacterium]|nr:hypothetical protein [Polyangiaceae bacterium]
MADQDFENLVKRARHAPFTAEQREAQRRSFAFGNASLDNPDVTCALVDQAAEALEKGR